MKLLIAWCSAFVMLLGLFGAASAQQDTIAPGIIRAWWRTGDPPQYLVPEEDGFCFLSGISGNFIGRREIIRIWSDGSAWFLGGNTNQAIYSQATCVLFDLIKGADDGFTYIERPGSINWERALACSPWPLCDQGNKLVLGDSSAFCYLTGVGGNFDHAWYIDINRGKDGNVLRIASDVGFVRAEAGCIRLDGHPELRRADDFYWSQDQQPVGLPSMAEAFCVLTGIQGQFRGRGDELRINMSFPRQSLSGDATQNDVQGNASCMYFDQSLPGLPAEPPAPPPPILAPPIAMPVALPPPPQNLADQMIAAIRANRSGITNPYPAQAEQLAQGLAAQAEQLAQGLAAHLAEFQLPSAGITAERMSQILRTDDAAMRIHAVVNGVWRDWDVNLCQKYGWNHYSEDPAGKVRPFRQLIIRLIQGRQGVLSEAEQRALESFFTRSEDFNTMANDMNAIVGAIHKEYFP